jgi:Glycosyl transferase family 2
MRHPGFQPPKQNQRVERFAESAARFPLSFVVCVSDPEILGANLRASPCLSSGSPHEVISVRNAPNAAAGLNLGLERAKNEWVVCVHQDVYLPRGWDRRLVDQLDEAESCWRPILGLHRPERFCSVDQGIFGHLTRRNLAALAEERADHTEAARLWREVLAECPGDPEAMHKLDQLEREHFSNAKPGASIR